jgi:hypothetical protein
MGLGDKKKPAEAGSPQSDDAGDCKCAEKTGSQEQGDIDQHQ